MKRFLCYISLKFKQKQINIYSQNVLYDLRSSVRHQIVITNADRREGHLIYFAVSVYLEAIYLTVIISLISFPFKKHYN